MCPGFPSPFGHRHSLLGHPIPAGGLGLPHGRLTDLAQGRARTPTGLPRSAHTSCDRGGCPLNPEDGGAHPGWVASPTSASGFPPSFAPRRPKPDDARRGRDRPPSTDLKQHLRHQPNLHLACLLMVCDLASHGDEQVRRDVPAETRFRVRASFGWRRGFVTACVRWRPRRNSQPLEARPR
jgi:hypothetical protein